jgi:hypothetical protein
MAVALVAGLVLVTVPLYLWRRPEPTADRGAAGSPRSAMWVLDGGIFHLPAGDALAAIPPVKLSRFRTIRCVKGGPGTTPPERCDHITVLEEALAQAIRKNASIGPSTRTGAQVSFVMDVDFRRKRLKIYRGKSSSVPKGETRDLFRRVRATMPSLRWDGIRHQHFKYVVYVVAAFPPNESL